MSRVVAACFAWGLVPVLTVACAAGEASDVAADAGSVCEPGKVDLNGDPADGCEYACTPGPHAPDDPIDPSFVDENCDGTDGVVASCLFVAGSGADDFLGGAPTRPLRTIPFAVDLARQKHRAVCLAGEAFTGFVVLASGVSVYGGFDATDRAFPFRRSQGAHTSITAEGTVVLASGIDADTHVEGLELHALVPADRAAGLGAYGVRLTGGGATLFVRWNTIATDDARSGGDGAPGADGAPGIQGRKGQNGVSAAGGPAPGNGGSDGGESVPSACGGAPSGKGGQGGWDKGNGANGDDGSEPAAKGGGGGNGSQTCGFSSGGSGGKGGDATIPGPDGSAGAAPAVVVALGDDGLFTPAIAPGGVSGAPGSSGAGGGGGAGGTNGGLCNGDRGGGGGSGGTGGCGGASGTGGEGGGASLGIAAVRGKLVVAGNTLRIGRGGSGGNGGAGGKGGGGGAGGLASANGDDGGAGGGGGNGAPGGSGGGGAGGLGGPSACIAVTKSVALDQASSSQCTLGGGGAGGKGAGPANDGPSGPSAELLTL